MNIVSLFKKYWNSSKNIHDDYGFCRIPLMLDQFRCYRRLGANCEDYRALEFYRKSWREKQGFVTLHRNYDYLFERMYDDESVDTLQNKELFNKKFSKYIRRGWISTETSDELSIQSFIEQYREVIVKPIDQCEGVGIYKLNAIDSEGVNRLFGEKRKGNHFIIEEVIESHPDISKLNPSSVNTIRLETVIDNKGQVHITNSVIIMGTNDSCVSNTHSGGIMCHIDYERGVIDGPGRNPNGDKIFVHPYSGIKLVGYQLPNWDGIDSYVRELASVLPKARFIGWDIVILENGYDVIEGNDRPGHCTQACDDKGRWDLIKSMI